MGGSREQLAAGLRAAREKAERLRGEDVALAQRADKLSSDLAAAAASDGDALAAVRSGVALSRRPARPDGLQHELDVIVAARRALAGEIEDAEREAGSLSRTLDLAVMREIGARVVANGARIDRALADLAAAIKEAEALYAEALVDRRAFRLGLQSSLQQHLCDAWRVGNALPHVIRDLARSPHDVPHRVEDLDRQFFRQLDEN